MTLLVEKFISLEFQLIVVALIIFHRCLHAIDIIDSKSGNIESIERFRDQEASGLKRPLIKIGKSTPLNIISDSFQLFKRFSIAQVLTFRYPRIEQHVRTQTRFFSFFYGPLRFFAFYVLRLHVFVFHSI